MSDAPQILTDPPPSDAPAAETYDPFTSTAEERAAKFASFLSQPDEEEEGEVQPTADVPPAAAAAPAATPSPTAPPEPALWERAFSALSEQIGQLAGIVQGRAAPQVPERQLEPAKPPSWEPSDLAMDIARQRLGPHAPETMVAELAEHMQEAIALSHFERKGVAGWDSPEAKRAAEQARAGLQRRAPEAQALAEMRAKLEEQSRLIEELRSAPKVQAERDRTLSQLERALGAPQPDYRGQVPTDAIAQRFPVAARAARELGAGRELAEYAMGQADKAGHDRGSEEWQRAYWSEVYLANERLGPVLEMAEVLPQEQRARFLVATKGSAFMDPDWMRLLDRVGQGLSAKAPTAAAPAAGARAVTPPPTITSGDGRAAPARTPFPRGPDEAFLSTSTDRIRSFEAFLREQLQDEQQKN